MPSGFAAAGESTSRRPAGSDPGPSAGTAAATRPRAPAILRPIAVATIAGALLAGCALAPPRPLPTTLSTQASVGRLERDPAGLDLPPLPKRAIDPARGLDPTDVAILAVLNSPDLKAKRAAAGVAAAQVFAARLLPDPQVGATADFPLPGQGAQIAYGVTPTLDVVGLITHAAALKAARQSRRQADLDLLWAEWGTAQQARALVETILAEEAKAQALSKFQKVAAMRAQASAAALARRDVAGQTASADVALAADAQTALAQAQHDAAKARLDLNALIGLDPGVTLPLVASRDGDWDKATIERARTELARRRPDLIALQAGYAAEEANLRKAVLAQFPVLNLGFSHARDNTGITSNGLSANFTLPIFNRGRGQIAIEKATREQLRQEYQGRLDQTDAEVAADLAERTSAEQQAERLARDVSVLAGLADKADAAYRRNDLDGASYVTLAQNLLTKTADLQDRRLAARLAEITLETALFLPPAASEGRP
jgi:outer membrane protein TolC